MELRDAICSLHDIQDEVGMREGKDVWAALCFMFDRNTMYLWRKVRLQMHMDADTSCIHADNQFSRYLRGDNPF